MIRPTPVRRKTAKRSINQAIDLIMKAKVLERDGHRCVRCQKTERLAASHILPKGKYPRMRFELDNLLTMCVGCHIFWWHKNPAEANDWLEAEYPGLKQRLQIMAAVARKVDAKELLVALQWRQEP